MRFIKKFSAALVVSAFLLASPVIVFAEGPGSDPTFNNDQVTTTDQITQETPSTETSTTTNLTEDNTKSFLTGVGAGVVVGLIVGGVFAWLFKDKILSTK